MTAFSIQVSLLIWVENAALMAIGFLARKYSVTQTEVRP
jgi:hypothetical protein